MVGDDQGVKPFGEAAAQALTNAQASPRHATGSSMASFAKFIRLWDAMLPKRQGDELGGALLVKGYHRMLGHLSEAEMGWLTEMVLDECKWFPTVAECKEMMGRHSYANPFYKTSPNAIGTPAWWNAARLAQANGKLELENRLKDEKQYLLSQLEDKATSHA